MTTTSFNRSNGVTDGKALALQALSGQATYRIPFGLLVWGFDYTFKVAGLEPWQLALGSYETYYKAHMALYERHKPDILWYLGPGTGEKDPTLIEETETHWIIKDENWGKVFRMDKTGLALQEVDSGRKTCDSYARIQTYDDVDRLGKAIGGCWSEDNRQAFMRLQNDLGDKCLLLPNICTSYIAACYTLGFERSMEMMLSDPKLFLYLCEKLRSREQAVMEQFRNMGVLAVLVADAWASCDIVSPKMWDTFCLPYHKSVVEEGHKAGLKIIMWNEGDVVPILDREASIDFDAYSIEQPRKGFSVTVDKVRAAFGPDRCILGNLDSEHLLTSGNEDEIREGVWDIIRHSGKGSPFIMCTGSPIPSDATPEAVDCMIEATDAFEW